MSSAISAPITSTFTLSHELRTPLNAIVGWAHVLRGRGFNDKVRDLPPSEGGRTSAAALTAFARAEDRVRALQAGYQSHAAKPVKPSELTAVVLGLAAQINFGPRRK